MDISKEYIKMCDCPEIQEYRKKPKSFQVGDFMANYYLGEKSKAILDEVLVFEITHHIKNRMLVVWLPRQDQIQEMLGKTESAFCIYQLKDRWGGEIYQDREQVFDATMDSPEQLWLAFYVRKKHKKIWDSEKWEKK